MKYESDSDTTAMSAAQRIKDSVEHLCSLRGTRLHTAVKLSRVCEQVHCRIAKCANTVSMCATVGGKRAQSDLYTDVHQGKMPRVVSSLVSESDRDGGVRPRDADLRDGDAHMSKRQRLATRITCSRLRHA
jgi:hypothetical protein